MLEQVVVALRTRWRIAVAVSLLGVLLGGLYFVLTPPLYASQTSLYVSAQTGDNPQQAFQGAQLSEQRVKSYTELVTSPRVIDEVRNRLQLATSRSELTQQISATSALDSVIITISATDKSPVQAKRIADSTAAITSEVVADLERPADPILNAPVAVRTVQPADVPAEPSSAGLLRTMLVGLAIGCIGGALAAFVRHSSDTTIRTLEQLAEITGAPNLGAIEASQRIAKDPLVMHSFPQSSEAEAFRQIRTNIQFVAVDQPRRVLVMTSSMPEEGKTTTVANIAIALSAAGARVLVVDADLRRSRVARLFGLDVSVGLTTVLSGKIRLTDAIQQWNGGALNVLASGLTPPNPSELLGSNQMRQLIAESRENYDLVLLDCPPVLPVTDAAALAPASDGVVIACRHGATTGPYLHRTMQLISGVSATVVGTVFTMVPTTGPQAYGSYGSYYGGANEQHQSVGQARTNGFTKRSVSDEPTSRIARRR